MFVTPREKITEYESKGWWEGTTIDDLFQNTAEAAADQDALVDPPNRQALEGVEPERLSWGETQARVERLAAVFLAQGLKKDDRLVVQLPNTVDAVITFLAASRLGLIVSPVVMQYREHELGHVFEMTRPAAFVTVPRFQDFDQAGLGSRMCEQGQAKLLLFGEAASGTDLRAAMADSDPATVGEYRKRNPTEAGEVLTICWTSGTESRPKGVPRTHNHWILNARVVIEATGIRDGDTLLNPFPLVNIGSIGGLVLPWLQVGGKLVLHHPFDIGIFLSQIDSERVTYTIAPPAVLGALLKQPDLMAKFDIRSLRGVGSGSAPLSPWLIETWKDDYGIEITNVFGSNEGSSLFSGAETVPDPGERARYFPRYGANGANWPGLTAEVMLSRIVDPDTGEEITEPGLVGELCLGGATMFDGYWNSPELNEAAFDDRGYYRTGDLFEIAGPGGRFYQFVGRSKEIIVRGGVNISPAELDDLIVGQPMVREAATVGIPDERLGERIAVAIVPHEGHEPHLSDIAEWLSDHNVAIFKRPEFLVTVDALPRNAMNKVERDRLREMVMERL